MKATFRAGILLLDCVNVLNQSVHNLSSLTVWRVLWRSRIHPGPDKYPGRKRNICRMKVLPPLAPSPTVF